MRGENEKPTEVSKEHTQKEPKGAKGSQRLTSSPHISNVHVSRITGSQSSSIFDNLSHLSKKTLPKTKKSSPTDCDGIPATELFTDH